MHFHFLLSESRSRDRSKRANATYTARLKQAAKLAATIEFASIEEVELHAILLSDAELLELNRSALGHDWLTDIITFEIERAAELLQAEIYLSVDRARENARRYHVSLLQELEHLVIHGMLHLAGMKDKTPLQKKQMRARERWYLAKLRE
ncbi:MAG: rRNA maturation RNase YbeY [Bacteroidota bacterium]|nr:rRNA maturation RNase YbeY [Bacteroidota bacterium]MDP4232131.1 rRNA maturation RNase YbeY [Bacteroidota bacterium]MDP4241161.1 rRNA maturation RNase YbeY [Bacteroidota bacterium]MDP4286553.1 rRNA maturation RNase YbeY [Bacteroidota bacterium]